MCTIWYMYTERSAEIEAPTSVVWAVYADVERWPDWTASVERVVALDGPGIEVGKRFEIKQPRMPKLVWAVTEVDIGVSWTWRQRSFGATAVGSHEVAAIDARRTRASMGIDQRGPIGLVVGRAMAGLTQRYLDLEARGLKERSEQRHRDAPPA